MIPQRIYLSGGGTCAIAHIGALLELSNHIPLKAIKEWMGVSAGSLMAMCLCIGYTLKELEEFCLKFDFTNIREYDSVPGWLLHFGIDTGERLYKLLEACLHVKGLSSEFTFKDCYDKFGITLRVVATDLNDAKAIHYSPKDTPNYRIADAVRASMSFPYYFQPHICPVSGHYLIDGGVISNHPLFVLPKEEHSRTLSLLIYGEVEAMTNLIDAGLEDIIMRPIRMVLLAKQELEMKFYDAQIVKICLNKLNTLEFSFNEETKNSIIEIGKKSVINYFKNKSKPNRRHSVS
jgi:NTE family protein|uniref:PNPLA domain-containing protein n=1 Tax=viral metagenome TaxID=1070528 RepID=A0A6C0DVB8_9ZZZZ